MDAMNAARRFAVPGDYGVAGRQDHGRDTRACQPWRTARGGGADCTRSRTRSASFRWCRPRRSAASPVPDHQRYAYDLLVRGAGTAAPQLTQGVPQ